MPHTAAALGRCRLVRLQRGPGGSKPGGAEEQKGRGLFPLFPVKGGKGTSAALGVSRSMRPRSGTGSASAASSSSSSSCTPPRLCHTPPRFCPTPPRLCHTPQLCQARTSSLCCFSPPGENCNRSTSRLHRREDRAHLFLLVLFLLFFLLLSILVLLGLGLRLGLRLDGDGRLVHGRLDGLAGGVVLHRGHELGVAHRLHPTPPPP